MSKLEEFAYRKMFHLSKREMLEEPLDDIQINFKLNQLVNKKQNSEASMPRQQKGGSVT